MQFSSFITNKIIQKLIEWGPRIMVGRYIT